MKIERWLNEFIDESDLDLDHVFEIEHEGTLHLMDFEVVVDSILALPPKSQIKIKKKIVAIDSENGDIIHYLDWVALGFIKYEI